MYRISFFLLLLFCIPGCGFSQRSTSELNIAVGKPYFPGLSRNAKNSHLQVEYLIPLKNNRFSVGGFYSHTQNNTLISFSSPGITISESGKYVIPASAFPEAELSTMNKTVLNIFGGKANTSIWHSGDFSFFAQAGIGIFLAKLTNFEISETVIKTNNSLGEIISYKGSLKTLNKNGILLQPGVGFKNKIYRSFFIGGSVFLNQVLVTNNNRFNQYQATADVLNHWGFFISLSKHF